MSSQSRSGALLLLTAIVTAGTAGVARGQAPPLAEREARATALSPTPSTKVMLAAGALLGAAFLLDRHVREDVFLERRSALAPLAGAGTELGRQRNAVAVLGALYLAGQLAERPRLSDGATRAGAGLLATGLVDHALKFGIGRERPNLGGDGDEFVPGSLSGSLHAFPSQHTALAFSLATSVAEETRDPRWSVLAYGMAGLVGWSRVYHDEHWASDVVGGAIVGTLATRATNRWLRARDSGDTPAVVLSPEGVTVRLSTF